MKNGEVWGYCQERDENEGGTEEMIKYFKKFSKDTEFYRKKDFSIKGCRCGEVLQGKIKPEECPLFRKICTPQNPLGPCMVSIEGACLIHYKYA